jgi:hyperosmotically inducible protein
MKALPTFTPALALRFLRQTKDAEVRPTQAGNRLCRRITKRLEGLPGLSIFDQLDCSLEPDRVILTGQVVRTQLRSDAELEARRLAGSRRVENRIELLPATPYDERIRLNVAAAVLTHPVLKKYAKGHRTHFRILVKDGAVTLAGKVSSAGDRVVAALCAAGAAGTSIQNELVVTS